MKTRLERLGRRQDSVVDNEKLKALVALVALQLIYKPQSKSLLLNEISNLLEKKIH